ncbi:YoaK family protein [uncultured Ferrimonas sp.]|uniref:YoaK family protein n=1 Tax=uncultured Ferrimonas sp. TaxID=432640 RepID=UPI002615B35F|nr:YoaK family protein [uncultured Ferrimonas sp.]
MITKLPKWMELGALMLALQAGVINAIGLLGLEHQAVSHISGSVTRLGVAMAQGQATLVLHLAGVLLSFGAGAMLSGLVLTSGFVKLGRFYDLLLLLEALLLTAALWLLQDGAFAGLYLASMACGLQNAMVTRYSGAIVRTTHLTGVVTDLGMMLGGALRGERFDKRKAGLLLLLCLGFVMGGGIGALLFGQWQFHALLLPMGSCLVLAALYRGLRQRALGQQRTD